MIRVTVLMPVLNEASHIAATLEGLHAQDFPHDAFEILVIDGGSEDATVPLVRALQPRYPNLQLFFNPQRLSSSARNIGVRHASGEYIVVVDGHCRLNDPKYLARLAEAFETSGADCLGRPQPLRTREPSRFQVALAAARESWLGHNPDSANFSDRARFVPPDNVAVAYRREVFARIGLFDEKFDACEDVEFNVRARKEQLTCFFTPAIRLDYVPRSTLRGLLKQMFRYGTGRGRLRRKHPDSFSLPSVVPALWLVWLAMTLLGAFFRPEAAIAFVASVIVYLSVIGLESIRLAWRERTQPAWVALVLCGIHVGFGWGYLRESLRGWR